MDVDFCQQRVWRLRNMASRGRGDGRGIRLENTNETARERELRFGWWVRLARWLLWMGSNISSSQSSEANDTQQPNPSTGPDHLLFGDGGDCWVGLDLWGNGWFGTERVGVCPRRTKPHPNRRFCRSAKCRSANRRSASPRRTTWICRSASPRRTIPGPQRFMAFVSQPCVADCGGIFLFEF
jgi:hypothetical protein